MGRGKDDPHFRVDFDNKDKKLPIIACDFAQLRGEGEDGGTADSVGETLVAYDCDVGFTKAIPLPAKGTSKYAVLGITRFIQSFFHSKVVLRSGNEPAILALCAEVEKELPGRVIVQSTPRYSSPSTPAERAIQIIEEQFRTLKLDCEARYGIKIHTYHIVRPWIIRHAGYLAARYRT